MENLVTAILPHTHYRQDHLLLAAHFYALMPAAVEKGLAGRHQDLHPHAIDDQDRRGVGNRALAPALHGRLGGDSDPIDSFAREDMTKDKIERLLQVTN